MREANGGDVRVLVTFGARDPGLPRLARRLADGQQGRDWSGFCILLGIGIVLLLLGVSAFWGLVSGVRFLWRLII